MVDTVDGSDAIYSRLCGLLTSAIKPFRAEIHRKLADTGRSITELVSDAIAGRARPALICPRCGRPLYIRSSRRIGRTAWRKAWPRCVCGHRAESVTVPDGARARRKKPL